MKRILAILLLISICCSCIAKNKALLIGVGRYQVNSGWRDISSSNDLALLKRALPSSFEIQLLENNQATYESIQKALKNLVSRATEGDTIYFHFSGHGQQMITDDISEPDGLDEALVPYDAPNRKTDTYTGTKHLRDNELGKYLDDLRKRVGANGLVIVCLDACYSDSMNKGEKDEETDSVIYRGGSDIFGIEDISQTEVAAIYKKRMTDDDMMVDNEPGSSDIIVLSACKSYQRNREIIKDGVGYGPLSYAIAESFGGKDIILIQEWLDKVLDIMHREAYNQTPVLRTTLEYQESVLNDTIIDDGHGGGEEDNKKTIGVELIPLCVLSGIVIVMLVLFLIRYGKRNKK
jgi:hypothetical protein